jgi:hypothetical protein
MPYLNRTEFVLQTSKQHFNGIPEADPNKALLGVFLTFLICISFYSEAELAIVTIVKAKIGRTDQALAELVTNTQKGILSRLNKGDLADTAKLFGTAIKDAFNSGVSDQDVTLYSNLITQRHAVAHSEDGQLLDWRSANLTMLDAENGIAAAERLLGAFEAALQ